MICMSFVSPRVLIALCRWSPMNRFVPLILLALSACATARTDRSQLAFAPTVPSATEAALAVAEGVAALPEEAIDVRLARFLAESEQVRALNPTLQPMPHVQRLRWEQLLLSVSLWQAASPELASGPEGAALRDRLHEALAADAGSYGALPDGWLEQVRSATAELGIARAAPRVAVASKRRRVAPSLSWPMAQVRVSSDFGTRRHPIFKTRKLHKGVDLVAAKGDRVLAAGTGKVIAAHRHRSYGLHVQVDHGDGVVSTYSHLSSMLVKRGDEVQPGDEVGLAGRTGRATGVHLHFEVLIDGRPVNPLKLLGPIPKGSNVADGDAPKS